MLEGNSLVKVFGLAYTTTTIHLSGEKRKANDSLAGNRTRQACTHRIFPQGGECKRCSFAPPPRENLGQFNPYIHRARSQGVR